MSDFVETRIDTVTGKVRIRSNFGDWRPVGDVEIPVKRLPVAALDTTGFRLVGEGNAEKVKPFLSDRVFLSSGNFASTGWSTGGVGPIAVDWATGRPLDLSPAQVMRFEPASATSSPTLNLAFAESVRDANEGAHRLRPEQREPLDVEFGVESRRLVVRRGDE